MVTAVAFVAATVNVEAWPAAVMDAGLALMVTVGDEVVGSPGPVLPHPASSRRNEKLIASGERMERKGRETRTFFMVKSFLCSGERQGLGFKPENHLQAESRRIAPHSGKR
jgi:hypothetical protein